MRWSLTRFFILYVILCILLFLSLVSQHSPRSHFRQWRSGIVTRPEICPFDAPPIKNTEDYRPTSYRRAIFRPHFEHGPKPSLSKIDGQVLVDHSIAANGLSEKLYSDCGNVTVTTVDVSPDPSCSETEQVLFGVATDIDRIESSLSSIAYFIGGSKASLLALVPPQAELKDREAAFRARDLDITLVPSDLPFTERYFHLIRALNDHIKSHRPDTNWVALVDDDTFFSAPCNIGARLASLSHEQYYWIGALSEAKWQVNTFGRIAFGGAGILASVSLLRGLDEIYDACASEEFRPLDMGGDGRLAACIGKFEPTLNVTIWDELRQWDVKGDPDGVFEAGRPIWSFHHWRSGGGWMSRNIINTAAVNPIAGEQSMLRRWMFDRTGSKLSEKRAFYVMTNGYSIVHYVLDPGVPEIDFDETEFTWDQGADGYEESLGPLRPIDVKGVTRTRYLLADARKVGENVHQYYEHSNELTKDDIEIAWLGGSE